MTTFVYVCDRLGKSLTHKCFFGMLERAAQLDLPSKKNHVVSNSEMHWKNCELKDVARCWKMLKDVERPGHGFGSEKIHHHSLPVAHRLNPRRNLREHWRRREPWTGSSVVESSHPPVGWGNVVKPRETTWNLVLLKSSQISLAFWFISRLSRYVSLSLRSKQPVALKIRNMSEGVFLTLNQVVLTRRSS